MLDLRIGEAFLREEEPVNKDWSGIVRRNRIAGEGDNGMSGHAPTGGGGSPDFPRGDVKLRRTKISVVKGTAGISLQV